jgi:hypothetical protein
MPEKIFVRLDNKCSQTFPSILANLNTRNVMSLVKNIPTVFVSTIFIRVRVIFPQEVYETIKNHTEIFYIYLLPLLLRTSTLNFTCKKRDLKFKRKSLLS